MTDFGEVRLCLQYLVETYGVSFMVSDLNIAEGVLDGWLSGETEPDEAMVALIGELYGRSNMFAASVEESEFVDDLPVDMAVGLDLDGDGRVDVQLEAVGLVQKDVGWISNLEQRRQSLRSNWVLAMMTQFRLDMTYQEHVAALGLVTQIELALIGFFRESMPDPGVDWDGQKRAREIEHRLARLRWVQREQEKEYGGLKGVVNWLMGNTKISGKELYKRMVQEAEGILTSYSDGAPNVDRLAEVMTYTGGEYMLDGPKGALPPGGQVVEPG